MSLGWEYDLSAVGDPCRKECAVHMCGCLMQPECESETDRPPVTWQVFALVCLAMSVSAAILASLYLAPYTLDAPKKVYLQHLHTQVRHVMVPCNPVTRQVLCGVE